LSKIDDDDNPVVMLGVNRDANSSGAIRQGVSIGTWNLEDGLMCNDEWTSLYIPVDGIAVTVYKNNKQAGAENTISGKGMHFLGDYGLNDEASSLRIAWIGYVLGSPKLISEEVIKSDKRKTIASKSTNTNDTDIEQEFEINIATDYATSQTFSYENSVMVGVSVETEAELPAVGGASVETSVENTFTFGEENGTAETVSFGGPLKPKVPPKKTVYARLTIQPVTVKQVIEYTLTPADGFSGKPRKTQVTRLINTAIDAEVVYSYDPAFKSTEDKAAVSATPTGTQATSIYVLTQNSAIAGHNNRRMNKSSTEQCKQACNAETQFTCRSFDYIKSQNACDLSDKSATQVGGLKAGSNYDHFARVSFTQSPNSAISGHNNKRLNNSSVAQCMQACGAETSFTCRSFDYIKSNGACDLSDKSAEMVGGLTQGSNYDHYARDF
jgi:hypothetical protein